MRSPQKVFRRLVAVAALVWIGLALSHPGSVSSRSSIQTNSALPPHSSPSTVSSSMTLSPELAIKFQPALLKQLLSNGTAASAVYRILIQTKPLMADTSAAKQSSGTSQADQRAAMVNNLQSIAARSQAGLLAYLDQVQRSDQAGDVRSLWINNSVAARVDRSTLLALAARPDVLRIDLDQYRQWVIDQPLTGNGRPPFADHDRLAADGVQAATAVNSPSSSVEWNIAKIRADQVWSALGISGTGVVVANMDTGVDWQHPALLAAYRGYNFKNLPNHLYSWFDATPDADAYPYDGYGHGTHTMGTLVGSDGIGVAPGAKWIAARVLDSSGRGYDSWIHAGFQWILAPGGDPSKAPNVLSNSWGNSDGYDQSFSDDLKALNAAGIATFFSNGNNGPGGGTVGSPASLPGAFGVGATDDQDIIAYFSSRGPSPFGPIKPDVSAPGMNIRSSYPGGVYRIFSGT
ncbi:MAG TPA: S8 family serine peptidase, partial [Anaerolineae bacterium]|nr:S8 family serine peptidase [Anaerolineae bacterium]